jgi:hypothetical protein
LIRSQIKNGGSDASVFVLGMAITKRNASPQPELMDQ